ncbi:GH92 family glycosyl hydrolase [Polaribacter sp. BAL334]|uniref:GH92 family glycosyl hydrolase n=1 Tax=Polaribacter sp. BAL334 TaxID=1708178 RepID=UPI0018D1FD7A|nr:GH92 family glycosyl hydrolase [Polaribacter sp. BAL334]MBG7613050.1 GH92 family glycosyl hydrolase [Polaribacter sp. BAL334]
MKLKNAAFFIALSLILSCQQSTKLQKDSQDKRLISFVNPFIGTGGHGHTFPGATLPFGMMQLSPDTRLDGWDGCSGYHYSDNEIYGFSHTHLSGTGVSDYGDILLMPTNKAILNNGSDGKEGYKSKFSHENEIAEPGFYKVLLENTNIDVELTVSKRSGIQKYQFPTSENQVVILDLTHRDELIAHEISLGEKEISGYRFSKAWATDQRLFYQIKFSHPIKELIKDDTINPKKMAIEFINPKNDPIIVKIGISAVDIEGAKRNLEQEIGNKSFEEVKKIAQETWENQLQKIVIEDANHQNKVNFYTAMYHAMIAPNVYQDVDGRYRGMDLEIHKTTDFEYYTVFSLWDTYRAAHPLYTIIEQKRTNDFINTFLAKYDEGGIMPIWDLSANYTGCMIGYHAVPVIADAFLKGIKNYDSEKAFQAMKHSAIQDKLGLESYKKFGFIPVEKESESVSKTLEYAYDDWTIAQMAKALEKENDYKIFMERAQHYKNVFDPETKFMRGRFKNSWFSPFDPYEVNFNYTEANSWQYSFYVPQDITGFMNLLGGKQALENQLDNLFTAKNETSGRDQADITGLIGQYAHGNEPSHHMAYLYNFVNKPHKTQEKVRQISTELYQNTPDGISGNEDCGQMSAWYIFSSLGFYPVTPGSNQYVIGSPLFEKATINLENGKSFTIQAKNNSPENKYIKSIKLNGKNYEFSYINHQDIINGGNLVFEMTHQPTNWGTKDAFIPSTEIKEHQIIPVPFIEKGEIAFKNSTTISLKSVDKNADIYYSLGREFKKYSNPFSISEAISLSVYGKKGTQKSAIIKTDFYKIDPNIKIELKSEYANQYNAGGNNALIDGILGTEDFRTGTWQGYFDTDLEAIVDLGKIKMIDNLQISFLKDQRSWIFLPKEMQIYTSIDGIKYAKHTTWQFPNPKNEEKVAIEKVAISKLGKARFLKIIAKKIGKLPEWHLGFQDDGRSWLFVDEIQIK